MARPRSRHGLTPESHSSREKERLRRISKMGNTMLRTLLILGATTVLRPARNGANGLTWITALLEWHLFKVVAVALTNDRALRGWALLAKGREYRKPSLAGRMVRV
jgi:transposase